MDQRSVTPPCPRDESFEDLPELDALPNPLLPLYETCLAARVAEAEQKVKLELENDCLKQKLKLE